MGDATQIGAGQIAVTVAVDSTELDGAGVKIEATAAKAKTLGGAMTGAGAASEKSSKAMSAAIDRLNVNLELAAARVGKAAGTSEWFAATAAAKGFGDSVASGVTKLKAAEDVAGAAAKAQRDLAAAQAEADRSAKAYAKTTETTVEALKREAATLGLSRTELMRYDIMKRDMTATQRAEALAAVDSIAAHEAQRASMTRTGMTAKETAFALRGIPAQFTDIFVSLQAGQNPMTVLLQQGGQLKDMFGGSVTGAFKAMGGYVLSLVTPLRLVAVAAGTLAIAWNKGDNEARDFQKSLILTGNAAGVTSSQLMTLAATTAASTGATKGASAEALNAIVASGKVSSSSLASVAEAAVNMQRYTGKAIGDTVKDFAELANDPVAAIKRLHTQYGFLTPAIYDQIKALDEQGKYLEAVTLAQDTFAASQTVMAKKIEENLGSIERDWIAIKKAAGGAWDAMAGIGRAETLPELQARLGALLEASKTGSVLNANRRNKEIAELAGQVGQKLIEEEKTKQDAIDKIRTDAHLKYAEDGQKYLSVAKAFAKEEAIIRETAAKGTPEDQADIERRVGIARFNAFQGSYAATAALQKAYDERSVAMEKERASASLAILTAEHAAKQTVGTAQKALDLQRLESDHASGLVSDKEYYDRKRAMRLTAMAEEWKEAVAHAAKLRDAKLAEIDADIAANVKAVAAARSKQVSPTDPAAGTARAAEVYKLETEGLVLAEKRKAVAADTVATMGIKAKMQGDILALKKEEGVVESATLATMRSYVENLELQSKYRDIELESLKLAEPMRATFLQGKREELDLERKIAELDKLRIAANDKPFTEADKQGYRDALKSAQANEANLNATKKAVAQQEAEWKKGWEETDKLARDVFTTWGEDGANVAKKIGDTLKRALLSAIYEATLKPVVFQIYQQATGALGMNMPGGSSGVLGAAQQGASLFGESNLVNSAMMSSAGQWLGLSTAGSTAATLGANGAMVGGASGLMSSASSVGYGATLAANGSLVNAGTALASTAPAVQAGGAALTAAGEGLLAAIPYVGWAIAGLTVLDSMGVFGKAGGPKTSYSGGSATSAFGAVNAANMGYAPTDAGTAAAVAQGIASYQALVSRFGGTSQITALRAAGESDPQGTARDSAGTSLLLKSGELLQNFQNFDKGAGQAAIPGMVNRAILEAFQNTDMGPVANALVAGLDPATITDTALAQVQNALAGAADLFTPFQNSLQLGMQAATATSAALTIELAKVGVSGGVSAASLKTAVNALDLTTAAGQDAARAILALEPAVKAYEASLGDIFGVTAASMQQDLFDAIRNSPDAASAGEAFANAVYNGINDALLTSYTQTFSNMIYDGVMVPLLDGVMKGQTLAQLMTDGAIETALAKAQEYATAFAAVMGDPRIKEFLAGIKTGAAAVGAGAYQPGFYVPPAPKKDTKADDASKEAAKNAEDLAKQMSDVAYSMKTLNMAPLAKSILDIARATDEAVKSATKLGATETDLTAIRNLSVAQTKQLIDAAGLAAARGLDAAQSGGLAAPYDLSTAQAAYGGAMGDLASSLKVTPEQLSSAITQSGGLIQAAWQYWGILDDGQKQSVIAAADAQSQIITLTKQSWDAQLVKVQQLQGWVDQIAAFSKGIDDSVFDLNFSLPGADQAGMLLEKQAELQAQFDTYQGRGNDEDVQRQITLAGKLKDTILQRYAIETAALQKTSAFIEDISDFSKSLKIGDLSPFDAVQRAVEARKQYSELMATLRNPASSADALGKARGKVTGAASDSLRYSKDTAATLVDYTREYARVQADMASLGADSLSVEEQQAASLKALKTSAAATIGELKTLQGIADSAAASLNVSLAQEVVVLGGINATLIGLGTSMTGAINALPNSIAAALAGYMGTAKPVTGTAPTTAATSGGNAAYTSYTASDVVGYINANNLTTPQEIYDAIVATNANPYQVGGQFGMDAGAVDSYFADVDRLPGFATGGGASAGGYIAGERGPELIVSDVATRIYPAEQTDAILNRMRRPVGTSNETNDLLRRMVDHIAELNRKVANLETAAKTGNENTGDATRILKNVTANGSRMLTEAI